MKYKIVDSSGNTLTVLEVVSSSEALPEGHLRDLLRFGLETASGYGKPFEVTSGWRVVAVRDGQ